ncbi:RND transporter MFP subunit [Bacteroidia bacterium]|nr:RND transporter MFP subunit [Bacteroidia bacterium]
MKVFNVIAVLFFVTVVSIISYNVLKRDRNNFYSFIQSEYRDITEKIYIAGNVYPVKEVEIKSQLSGIIDNIFVKIDDSVTINAPIATIKLVPNPSDIERVENNVTLSQIDYTAKQTEYKRSVSLFSKKVISKSEMDEMRRQYLTSKKQYESATNQLDLLKNGHIISKNISNIVTSSTTGIIIDIPIEIGASVIERNNYNPGTTIAIVADLHKFIFRALIAEHYVKSIKIGDEIKLSFNAYDSLQVVACIQKISSKGNVINDGGAVKYLIDAEFDMVENMPLLRSGYSASAEIILHERKNVLSIPEKYVHFSNDSIYVNIYDTLTNKHIPQLINIGVSDGTYVEIVNGLTSTDRIITKGSN